MSGRSPVYEQLRDYRVSGRLPVRFVWKAPGRTGVNSQDKLGIARNVRTGLLPINGVRMQPEAGTCGWYIWAGEHMSEAPDVFQPLHVAHLTEWCEPAMTFLLLPPGWRFLIAGDQVDVWFDSELDVTGRMQ